MKKVSPEEFLRAGVWKELNKLHTAIPCIVVNVQNDFKEQIVDVQPTINIVLNDGETVAQRPVIMGVPVVQFSSGKSALTMSIEKGDKVLCIFSMRALEVWQEGDGKPSTPNNAGKFHEKDAIAIPGLYPRKEAINNPRKRTLSHSTKDMVLAANIGTANEAEIRVKPSGDIVITSPSKVEINCSEAVVNATSSIEITSPTSTFNGDVIVNGDIDQTGTFTLDGVNVNTHTHPQANDSNGDTEQDTGVMQ